MQFHHLATPLLLAAGLGSATAQTVWRCADGYADRPCADGRSVETHAHDPGPAERRRAEEAMRANNRAADELVRRRTREEAAANVPSLYIPPSQLQRGDGEPPRRDTPETRATRKLELFTATVPGSGRKAGKDAPAAAKSPPAPSPSTAKPAAKPAAPATGKKN